jgi:N4-gp56 family major capsid protein
MTSPNAITTNQVGPEVRVYFDRLLLKLATPALNYDKFAQRRTIPMNSGDSLVFRRYGTLSAATTPLTEAVTPPGAAESVIDFSTKINWYGSFMIVSDVVQYTVQDRVLNELTKVLSLQMGLTLDTLARDMMVSTASTIACSHGTNGNTITEINDTDFQLVQRALRQGNAEFMTPVIQGENRFGTAPSRQSFWGFMSTDQEMDLEAVASFNSVANYANQTTVMHAEWGQTRNIRWLTSTNGFSNGASPNVYSSFVLGREAYGIVQLGAMQAQLIVKPLGSAGTTDALDQRSSVGFKVPWAGRLLNDNWIARVTATLQTNF